MITGVGVADGETHGHAVEKFARAEVIADVEEQFVIDRKAHQLIDGVAVSKKNSTAFYDLCNRRT